MDRRGYVYVIKEVNGPHYKIGRTKNPDDRMALFGVKIPYRIEFEVLLRAYYDMYELESFLHKMFADKRVDGEWFLLTTDDLKAIRSYKSAKKQAEFSKLENVKKIAPPKVNEKPKWGGRRKKKPSAFVTNLAFGIRSRRW